MKRVNQLLMVGVIGLYALSSLASEGKKSLEDIKHEIAEIVEERDLPSVSYTLVSQDGVQVMASLGLADIAEKRKATKETLYRIGSTSKMFVALSVLKLIEEGKLSLNDTVRSLAPEVEFQNQWEDEHPIRLVHLLEHTTGWDDMHLVEYAHSEEQPVSLLDGLKYHPHSRTSRWVPGTRMAYCNSGPPVAAYIVEKITGKLFEDYVEENFFNPLEMEGATYFFNQDMKDRGATLYNGDREPENYWHILLRPSGSINASIKHMANFLEFYIDRGNFRGKQLVSPESIARMERPESNPGAKAGLELGYGLHNYSSWHDGWYFREHNGGVNNGLSGFAYLPEAKAGYAVLLNSGDFKSFTDISKLLKDYITEPLQRPNVQKVQDLTPEQMEWAGYYQGVNPRVEMTQAITNLVGVFKVRFTEDKLEIGPFTGEWTSKDYPISNQLFQNDYTGKTHVALVEDPLEGRVLHMESAVYKRVSGFWVYFRLVVAIQWSIVVLSGLVYFVVWSILKLKKHKLADLPYLLVLPPSLTSFCVLAFVVLNMLALKEMMINLGSPGFYSIGLMLVSILFFVLSILSVISLLLHWRAAINKALYIFFLYSAIIHTCVAFYLLSFGLIGVKTWS